MASLVGDVTWTLDTHAEYVEVVAALVPPVYTNVVTDEAHLSVTVHMNSAA